MSNGSPSFPDIPTGSAVQLDLSDPEQYRFASEALAKSGSDRSIPRPGPASGGGEAEEGSFLPRLWIPYILSRDDVTFRSRAIALLPFMIDQATILLTLYDATTNVQFASSSETQKHGLFMSLGVEGDLLTGEIDGVTALATLYLWTAGPIPAVYTTRRNWKHRDAPSTPGATAVSGCQYQPTHAGQPGCVNDAPLGRAIEVRAGGGSGCDYSIAAGSTIFGCPAAGTATFDQDLATPLQGNALAVFQAGNGPGLPFPFDLGSSGFFQASGKELRWQIPADSFPLPPGTANGLFDFSFTIQTTLASGNTAVVLFTSIPHGGAGVFEVPQLKRTVF
jgi:hypothetical protein